MVDRVAQEAMLVEEDMAVEELEVHPMRSTK
jgi:hypothetical protein